MTENVRYMPVLQSRGGEFEALRNLDNRQRSMIYPIVTIALPKWDFKNDRPSSSVSDHVGKVALNFRTSWGRLHDIRVDGYLLDALDRTDGEPHPMSRMMEIANGYGIRMIPVTGLDRSAAYSRLSKHWAAVDRRGATIRIEKEDLLNTTLLTAGIKETLDSLGLSPASADIVFDLKAISETEESALADRVVNALSTLPYAREWRSVFLAATSFPENLGAIRRDSVGRIPRLEWEFWKSIDAQRRRFDRTPWFADYAVAHPAPIQIQNPRVSGNIRYTTESAWTVLKGHLIEKGDGGQMQGLCRELIDREEYGGRILSAGDRYIAQCAEGTVGPGSPSKWRFVGTSHHITFVLRQLQTHFEKTRKPRRVD